MSPSSRAVRRPRARGAGRPAGRARPGRAHLLRGLDHRPPGRPPRRPRPPAGRAWPATALRRSAAAARSRAGRTGVEDRLRDVDPYAEVVAQVRSGPPAWSPTGLAGRSRRPVNVTEFADPPRGRPPGPAGLGAARAAAAGPGPLWTAAALYARRGARAPRAGAAPHRRRRRGEAASARPAAPSRASRWSCCSGRRPPRRRPGRPSPSASARGSVPQPRHGRESALRARHRDAGRGQRVLDVADPQHARSGRRWRRARRRRRPRPRAGSARPRPLPRWRSAAPSPRGAPARISSVSKPGPGAVGVHGVEQDLARAELGGPDAPTRRRPGRCRAVRRGW